MPDYNLSALAARSFEQLIQSIALRVLGPGTTVFGDGPDGAREATFEGRAQYPSSEDPWDGYVIIQAKFKQRPTGGQSDARWVMTQLSNELRKFVNPRRGLRRPQYYVFCTNVVLTPAHGTGSKDRASQLLDQHIRRLKGKGFAIWDYDQIRGFLDAYRDIRETFAAWITPGDVLSQVMQSLRFSRPDFERTMTLFLQKELLSDQYVNLEQAGHSADERTPMARVFIDLPVATNPTLDPPTEAAEPEIPGIVSEVLVAGSQRLASGDVPPMGGRHTGPVPGRYVLIGGPGQGKTTVSQFICQLYRVSILRNRPSYLSPEAQQALELIESHCAADKTEVPTCRRFPVRVTLNHFARVLACTDDGARKSLISYLTDRVNYRTNAEVGVGDLRLWLKSYPWLLILDGLDEVPSSSNRDEVLAAIHEFWIDAAESQADILVLATTRPQGYDDDFSAKFYTHRYLTPLPSSRALLYGRRLATARYGSDPEREQRIITRLARAAAEPATSRLMRSPLQVTIMATLVDQTGQPPHERWRLFHDYYEVIYRRETEREIPAAELLRDQKSNIDEIHHRVGLLLQIESERKGLTDAHLSAREFAGIVRTRLSDEGYCGAPLDRLSGLIIEAAANRLVFLVGVEAGQIGFEIRSLQEFMAAESLMNGSDTLVAERLNLIAPISHWRNVFLFCAGRCFAVDQHRRDTVLSICLAQNESEEEELLRKSLAGSQLALDILVDGAAHRQPKFERILARAALRLMDRPAVTVHQELADVYEESMETVYMEEAQNRLNSADTGICASAWAVVLGLVDRDVMPAIQLAEANWAPSTGVLTTMLQEFDVFQKRYFRSEWFWNRVVDLMPQFPITRLWMFRYQIAEARGADRARALLNLVGEFRIDADAPFALHTQGDATVDLPVISIRPAGAPPESLVPEPPQRPDWRMAVATAPFSANPTPVGLAEGLRRLSAVWQPELRLDIVDRVPWPIGACIMSARSAEDLIDMAAAAESGALGSQEDWKVAEERWSRGISFADMLEFEKHDGRIGEYMTRVGFPTVCARVKGWRHGSPEDGKSAYEMLKHAKTQSTRNLLARCVVDWMATDGARSKQWDWVDAAKTKELLSWQDQPYIGLEALLALPPEALRSVDALELMDFIGREFHLWLRGDTDLTTLYRTAWVGFAAHPLFEGLLPVLAHCLPSAEAIALSRDQVNPQKYTNVRCRAASAVLSLIYACPDKAKARELGRSLGSIMSEPYDNIAYIAIQAISKGKVDPILGKTFLAELYATVASNWPVYGMVGGGIDGFLRRQLSGLGNPATLRRLELAGVAI